MSPHSTGLFKLPCLCALQLSSSALALFACFIVFPFALACIPCSMLHFSLFQFTPKIASLPLKLSIAAMSATFPGMEGLRHYALRLFSCLAMEQLKLSSLPALQFQKGL